MATADGKTYIDALNEARNDYNIVGLAAACKEAKASVDVALVVASSLWGSLGHISSAYKAAEDAYNDAVTDMLR